MIQRETEVIEINRRILRRVILFITWERHVIIKRLKLPVMPDWRFCYGFVMVSTWFRGEQMRNMIETYIQKNSL